MNAQAIFFPFDLFGGTGTRAGAELLADAFQEMLADIKRERVATRSRAFASKIRFEEFLFEKLADYQGWRAEARTRIKGVLAKNDLLFWITGNHLGALPLYEELGCLDQNALVLQLDAHLDIYNLGDCTSELSHGNFLIHAERPLPRIVNLGHRELLLRPDHIHKTFEKTYSAADVALDPSAILGEVRSLCGQAKRVLLDLDCDVFDPAYFPAVVEPRPFGLNPLLVLHLLNAIGVDRLCGLSISEFDPARDQRDRSLETLMWLIEYVLLWKFEAPRANPAQGGR